MEQQDFFVETPRRLKLEVELTTNMIIDPERLRVLLINYYSEVYYDFLNISGIPHKIHVTNASVEVFNDA